MTAQIIPTRDGILERLNAFLESAVPPSPFEFARLDEDIRRLSNADSAASQCFRGMYYALQGDLANTVKWFDMALSVNPDTHDMHIQYAAALCRLGRCDQAVKTALESISKGNLTPASLDSLVLSAYYADDQAVLDEWLPKYEKLAGAPHDVAFWLQEDAEDEAEIEKMGDAVRNGPRAGLDQIRKELGL